MTLHKSILVIPNPCQNIKYHVTSVLLNDAASTQQVTENKSEAEVVLTDRVSVNEDLSASKVKLSGV